MLQRVLCNRLFLASTRIFVKRNYPAQSYLCCSLIKNCTPITNCYIDTVNNQINKRYSVIPGEIDAIKFEEFCQETIESLCEYFEEIVEENPHLKSPDVVYGDGVLTVSFGEPYGTYVINRQTPNKQIWLSSPTSGPKRYDFVYTDVMKNKGSWIYKHDGISLHQLLQKEISKISKKSIDFSKCLFS